MRDGKLIAARRLLKKHGVVLADALLTELFDVTAEAPSKIYDNGDFIVYYEGMGEAGFGTVVGPVSQGYRVRTFDFNGRTSSHVRTIRHADMGTIETHDSANEYFDIRSGVKRVKLFLKDK